MYTQTMPQLQMKAFFIGAAHFILLKDYMLYMLIPIAVLVHFTTPNKCEKLQ
jgi:hypothetical protein